MSTAELERAPQQLIGGQWRTASGTDAIDVFNPATGGTLAEMPMASSQDVDDAVAAAGAAFESWSKLSLTRRLGYVQNMKAALLAGAEELAHSVTLDNGKTLEEARGEVLRAADAMDATLGLPMYSHTQSGNIAAGLDYRRVRIPLGVCAAITPFNFPVMNPTMFSAWALATGNTLVIKGSEQDPIATAHLMRIFQESGLPDGVLNVIQGNVEVAQRLITHHDVKAVSCITSSPAAKAIYTAATAAGKRCQANGGASNPIVVAADADIEMAAAGVVASAFGMSGQRCLAGSRLIILSDVYEQTLNRVVELSSQLVVGSGFDAETTMGPLISRTSVERIEQAVETALHEGATALLDGRDPHVGGTGNEGGYYVGPSILADVAPSSPVNQEEVFGPFITVLRAGDLDEAIHAANDTVFGNASSIYTTSGSTARAFEQSSDAGNIGINQFPAPPQSVSMGGRGISFYGDLHATGDEPMAFFTDQKLVLSRW
jgi:malonate-semialdehyde dehydrogenase (acetylating) / methylmalonate-semialdehyde dehydrogenase